MYEVDLSKEVKKFLDKQPNKDFLITQLRELKGFGSSEVILNIKKLHGKFKGKYRLRVGKVRFIFFIEANIIKIYEAGFRGNIYS